MKTTLLRMCWGVLLLGVSLPTLAGQLSVSIELPRLSVSEYHRPYVALWIARENQQVVADLSVWYDLALRDNEGEKWLKDMRQWWRRSGRTQSMPIDGVSGATRPPGKHELVFTAGQAPLGDLEPGQYVLMVEAAREVGGREIIRIPFVWPAEEGEKVYTSSGSDELGEVVLKVH